MKQIKSLRDQAQGMRAANVPAKTGAALMTAPPTQNNAGLARQMKLAEDIMRNDRAVLRALAR